MTTIPFYKESIAVSVLIAAHPFIIMAFYVMSGPEPARLPVVTYNTAHIEIRMPASLSK